MPPNQDTIFLYCATKVSVFNTLPLSKLAQTSYNFFHHGKFGQDAEGLNAPLPEWRLVHKMVLPTALSSASFSSSSSGVDAAVWTRPEYPDFKTQGGWDVNFHYARFVARVRAVVRDPEAGAGSQSLVHWVRDAAAEDAWWVLFHALLYLQLETMRERARNAPLGRRLLAMVRSQ
ncbi:hypothetical protein PG994_008431 [Apiospora phragmitis]|uniref:Uncharacterized protein n=1 Tax=Apiospora phragmitis TaxID=2905665 RepID=A0ABR1UGF1_9PEZI